MSKAYRLSEKEQRRNERIVKAFIESDDQIIYECYEDIYPMIYRFITSNSGDENDARTMAMECLEAFFECCQKPNFNLTCKFSSFIYSICRNGWLKKLKQRKRFPSNPLLQEHRDDITEQASYVKPLTADDYEETLFLSDLKRIILEFAEGISGKCYQITKLKFIEDKSHEEITKILGISIQASRKRLYDCNQKLAVRIANSRYYEELKEEYPLFEQFVSKYRKKKK